MHEGMHKPINPLNNMKRLLFCTLFLFASTSVAQQIDDSSSYESLFKVAYEHEMQSQNYLSHWALDALVTFNGLDLVPLIQQPYQKMEGEAFNARHMAASFPRNVAERLFRAGRIDEGIALLKEMLPPQAPEEGMIAHGYISESLLEQKRFEEAWQLAISGPPLEQIGNIARYIERTMAKTYYEKEPSGAAWIPNLPPWIPNEADAEIYQAEANRALEHLVKLSEQATDEQERTRFKYLIANTLAAVGRSEAAYALVENEQYQLGVLYTILRERHENGTLEEVDYWFQKVRKQYEVTTFDRHHTTANFLSRCIEYGKYHDAMDVIEKNDGRNRGVVGGADGYFDRIPKANVETNFRHNSKELVERMIQYHDKVADDESQGGIVARIVTLNSQQVRQNRFQFYPRIVKAQLNLGLVDDALASLRKITSSLEALETLGDIMFYVVKHKAPEEASRMEAEAIEMFKNVDELKGRSMGDYYLVHYFARMAVRLMQDGEAEQGERYLKAAIDWADAEHVRQEQKEGRRFNSHLTMGTVCGMLIEGGFLDEAADIVRRTEERLAMPGTHLRIANARAAADAMATDTMATDETEDEETALRKAFATFSQSPPLNYGEYSRMATLAIQSDDKEFFYEVLNAVTAVAEQRTWHRGGGGSEALGIFLRQLAVYGDKGHPLFAQAEQYADSLRETSTATNTTGDMSRKAEVYFSLGVSRAMLGDHENARRLLKKGIETRQSARFRSPTLCPCALVIEAWSFEKR